MCENHNMTQAFEWSQIGARIREARDLSGLSQEDVARELRIDRSAMMRMESGERKVSALELSQLATILDVPLRYFLSETHSRVVSRRSMAPEDADAPSRVMWRLELSLDEHARDVALLANENVLPVSLDTDTLCGSPIDVSNQASAREAAQRVRTAMRIPHEPLPPLADVCAQWGLYVLVVAQDVDGASMQIDDAPGYGAAVLGGEAAPGRKRFTAAHELGNHLLKGPYSSEIGVAATRDEREGFINAFADELLLPGAALLEILSDSLVDTYAALVTLSARYRVSWSLTVRAAAAQELIDSGTVSQLLACKPTQGDFLAIRGSTPVPDLATGATASQWKRAVLAAYEHAAISGPRAVELLHGAVTTVGELPTRLEPTA